MSEEHLPASEHRRRQALEQGQTAVSQDVVKLVKFACVCELAFDTRQLWLAQVASNFTVALNDIGAPWAARMEGVIQGSAYLLLGALATALCAAAAALIATLVQTGLNFAPQALDKGPKRLNPADNLKQLFSPRKLLMLILGPTKAALLLWLCFHHLQGQLPNVALWYRISPAQGFEAAVECMQSLERRVVVLLLAIALGDWALQRFLWLKSLRMDLQEARKEHKEQDGDPQLKGKRKSVAKEVALAPAPTLPSGASAVVVNPTHIAIALAYDFSPDSLPRVAGKVSGNDVALMREAAARRGVPVIRYVGLARRLYATGREGSFIPRDLIRPVALLYQAVEELTKGAESGAALQSIYELDEELSQAMFSMSAHDASMKNQHR